MDAYNGVDVTPVYIRRKIPANRADVHGLASTVSLANQFYLKGLWHVARALRECVENILGELPAISIKSFRFLERAIEGRFVAYRGSAGFGWISFSNGESANGWSRELQCLKSKRWVIEPVKQKDPLAGDSALLKCFGLIGQVDVDPDHLRTSVRYGNLALKRRWTYL
jgi:hypothetical protein